MRTIFLWIGVLAAGLAVTVGVFTGLWPFLVLLPLGVYVLLLCFVDPVNALIVYILGEPIMHNFGGISLGANIPDLKFDRMMWFIMALSFFVRFILRRWRARKMDRLETAMILYSIVVVVNCFRFPDASANFQWFLNGYGLAFLFYYIMRTLPLDEKSYDRILWTLVVSGVFLALLGVYQKATGSMLLVPADLTSVHIRKGRMTGTYGNAVEFGLFINFVFAVSYYLFMRTKDRTLKFVLGGVMLLFAICLYMSMTRAIWVSFFLTLVLIAWFHRPFARWLAAGLILGLALTIAFWPVVEQSKVVQERLLHKDPLMDRESNYKAFTLIFPKQPFFGNGYSDDAWKEAALAVMKGLDPKAMFYSSHVGLPHNEFVLTTVMMGLFGLFFYLYVLWEAAETSMHLTRRLKDEKFIMIFVISGIALIENAVFADIINFTFSLHLVMIFLGMAANPAAWKDDIAVS